MLLINQKQTTREVRALAYHHAMCPGFDSRTRRHMWIEFVVGSRPCSEGFSPGSPVFLPTQKINISKFQFDREFEGHGFIS